MAFFCLHEADAHLTIVTILVVELAHLQLHPPIVGPFDREGCQVPMPVAPIVSGLRGSTILLLVTTPWRQTLRVDLPPAVVIDASWGG